MPFKHPAALIGKDDIARIKQRLAAKLPFALRGRDKLGWDTKRDYRPCALPRVECSWGKPPQGHAELCDKDAVQCYLQTLSYLVHGDDAFAGGALAIVKAWSTTCCSLAGDNRVLEAAWSTTCFARSMELLKYTYPGYAAAAVEPCYLRWVDKVVMPALTAPITWTINGGDAASNWHAARTEALMQLAVLRNDERLYNAQVAEFRRILPIIVKPSGLGNEVLRDLMHAQFSLGSLAHVCELAHNATGLDLYKELNNRLAKGMEYVAAILLGQQATLAEVAGKELRMVAWHPAGAWGLAVTAYEQRGVAVPNSRRLLDRDGLKEYPWLSWGSTNLTHRTC